VTTTFSVFRNMSASPPIQWTDQEKESGAVSFAQHLSELREKLTTTTNVPSTVTPSTTRSTVEKIVHAVETVVPQIVETLHHEFVEPPTPGVSVGTTTVSVITTTPSTTLSTSTTTSVSLPPTCYPTDHVQVS
jgi:hypothetical protein